MQSYCLKKPFFTMILVREVDFDIIARILSLTVTILCEIRSVTSEG